MHAMNASIARSGAPSAASAFDVEKVRRDFPLLGRTMRGAPLAYLDNAATTQKPQAVLDVLQRFYSEECANIHRGVYELSSVATGRYEDARVSVQEFIGAAHAREIIFVRGTTEAINLVAQTYGRSQIGTGDEILISAMEHHSNIVPWQMLCEATGATLRVAPITDHGEIDRDAYRALLGPRTKLVALVHVSNVLGTINPVQDMIAEAHAAGAVVLVDGAQAVPHLPVDVQQLDCDFYAFSGHKLYGPTGIGVLYGKLALLDAMPPYQGGGDMIASVTFEKTTYAPLPAKLEAGTPHIAGAVGLAAAIEYVRGLGLNEIAAYEAELLAYGEAALRGVPGLQLIGTAAHKAGVMSFVMEGVHPHDVGTILDRCGVAIRTGHHCAQPVMERFGIPATARASVAFYNTTADIDALAQGLGRVREVFGL